MTQAANKPKRRFPWQTVLIVSAFVLVVALSWWFAGRKVWTDDRGVAVLDAKAKLREVLWSPPKELGALFEGDQQHYEPSFSPDGTELYFVAGKPGHNADIYVSYRRNNQWTKPEPVANVNSAYDDLGPRVTADGKFLLFYSDRPGGYGGYDIWASGRTKDGWGKPFNLGPNINSEFNEFTPDATPDGKHLIFATNRVAAKREQVQNWRATIRTNEVSDYDLWIAELQEPGDVGTVEAGGPATQPSPVTEPVAAPTTVPADDSASVAATQPTTAPSDVSVASTQPTTAPALSAEPLSPYLTFGPAHEIPGINTAFVEGASCMSPAGDFLYFASNRPGGFGKFDIWRSRVSADWKFGPVENCGSEINSADNETDPALAFNGYRLIFSSDRGSDTGVYRLFSSDSREVYSMRVGRPLPHLGLSFWIFLGSLLVLIPLLMMLRGWDNGRLGIMQKCLLISVLVQLLITLGLSFVDIITQAGGGGTRETGVEVAINLNPSEEMEVGTAIRRQSTAGDLHTLGAPPEAVSVSRTPIETVITPGPVDVSLPRASAMPEPLIPAASVDRTPPPIKPETVSAQPTAPTAELPQNDPLDVHLQTQHVMSQADVRPQVQQTDAQAARSTVELPQTTPRPLPATITPAAQAAPSPLAIDPGPIARPNLPAGGATDPARAVATVVPDAPAAPSVNIQQPAAEKVAGNDAAPTRSTIVPTTSNPVPLETASSHMVQGDKNMTPDNLPARPDGSQTATPSIPTPGAFHPISGPVVRGVLPPGTSQITAPPDVDTPKSTNMQVPVASGQPNAPQPQEASTGSARQGSAVANANPTGSEAPILHVASAPHASDHGPATSGLITTARAITPGPTTLPSDTTASSTAISPIGPPITVNSPHSDGPRATEDRPLMADTSSGPTARSTGPIAPNVPAITPGAGQIGLSNVPSKPDAASAMASASAATIPHAVIPTVNGPQVAGPLTGIPDAIEVPKITLPQPSLALPSPHPAAAGAGPNVPETGTIGLSSKQTLHGTEGGGTKNVPIDLSGPLAAAGHLPKEAGKGLDPISVRPHVGDIAPGIMPNVSFNLPTDIGTGKLNAPDSPFTMRAPEKHDPIIEKLGGNKQSEDAVAKALFWLSENQEEKGRWTMVFDNRRGKHPRSQHDTALTGLSLLAFLAQDNRPDKPGPYNATVTLGLEYLLSAQRPDGDLRGDSPGNGASQSNMYDHGIATYAMAEAAILSRDPRYIQAALKGADFIVKAQNEESGGWRYAPRDQADTSVFGWQVMALHSAEQVGFKIPEHTQQGIDHYIQEASSGKHKMLAAYQPHNAPTATMTAQLAFTRMLLGQQLTDAEMGEAGDFLGRTPPSVREADLYYWYYASLCMSQMRTPAWKSWNEKTRDALISMQKPDGEHAGYWDAGSRKGENAGRVFSTAMGALTLEVYYRYMPLQERNANTAPK